MAQKYVPVALRRLVRERAAGFCEYCRVSERFTLAAHWVDHIVAEKHGGGTEEANLALSCVLCNQHKGTDLASLDPETGSLVSLFHPRRDRWDDHFRMSGPRIDPRTAVGRVTVRLLQMNHRDRVQERTTWLHLEPGGQNSDGEEPRES